MIFSAIIFLIAFAVLFFMCWLCEISYKVIFVICVPMILYYLVTKLYSIGKNKLLPLRSEYVHDPDARASKETVINTYLYATGVVSPHYFAWIIMSLVPLEGFLSFIVIFPTALISAFCFVTLAESIRDITKRQWPFWIIQTAVFVAVFSIGRQFAFSMSWAGLLMP